MNKIIVLSLVGLLIASSVLLISRNLKEGEKEENIQDSKELYQGPVRPTDDEAYFRSTGITRPLVKK